MKIITYKKDGFPFRVTPAPQSHVCKAVPAIALLTEQEFLDWIISKDVPQGASEVQIVDE